MRVPISDTFLFQTSKRKRLRQMGNTILMPPEISDDDAVVGWTTVDETCDELSNDEAVSGWTTVEDISYRNSKKALINSASHDDTSRTPYNSCSGELMPSKSDIFAELKDATTPRPISLRTSERIREKSHYILESRETKKKIKHKIIREIETKACITRDISKDFINLEIGKSIGVPSHIFCSASEVEEFDEMNNEGSLIPLTDGSQSWKTGAVATTTSKSIVRTTNALGTPSHAALSCSSAPIPAYATCKIKAAGVLLHRYNPKVRKIEVLLGVNKKKKTHTILGGKAKLREVPAQTACRELWEECGGQLEQELITAILTRLYAPGVEHGKDQECRLVLLPFGSYALYLLSTEAVDGLEEASSLLVGRFESFLQSKTGASALPEMREMLSLEWVQIDALMTAISKVKSSPLSSNPSITLSYFARMVFSDKLVRNYWDTLAKATTVTLPHRRLSQLRAQRV